MAVVGVGADEAEAGAQAQQRGSHPPKCHGLNAAANEVESGSANDRMLRLRGVFEDGKETGERMKRRIVLGVRQGAVEDD